MRIYRSDGECRKENRGGEKVRIEKEKPAERYLGRRGKCNEIMGSEGKREREREGVEM